MPGFLSPRLRGSHLRHDASLSSRIGRRRCRDIVVVSSVDAECDFVLTLVTPLCGQMDHPMTTWTSGYVSEIDYTHGYYRELCPSVLQLACLHAGFAPAAAPGGQLHYLELGFGRGLSLNVHAAAHAGKFWGTDFNPSQAAHARSLASAAGSGAVLLD